MILDLLRLAVLFSGLAISSIQDWKTREIDDKIWVCMGIAGGMLTAADLAFQWSTSKLLLTAISIALAFIIGFSIYYLGLFGGADAKALLCIAVVTPYPPKLVEPILPSINPFFPITVFCNGLLLSLLIIPHNLLRNISWKLQHRELPFFKSLNEPGYKKLLALLICVKIKRELLFKTPHYHPAEITQPDGKAKLVFSITVKEDEEEQELLKKTPLEEWIWASPALPMLIFFTAGAVTALTVGDLAGAIAATITSLWS